MIHCKCKSSRGEIMEDIIDFLATKEVLIIIGLLIGVLFIYFVFWFVDYLKKMDRKRNLQINTMQLNRLVEEEAKLQKEQEQLPKVFQEKKPTATTMTVFETVQQTPTVTAEQFNAETVPSTVPQTEMLEEEKIVLESTQVQEVPIVVNQPELLKIYDQPVNASEEVIEYKDEVYTKTEAQQELERLTEELQKAQEEAEDKNIALTDFEVAQEENAIISLEELLIKGKTLTSMNEIRQYEDEGNEPISIEELEKRYQAELLENKEKEKVQVEAIEEKVEEPKREQISLFDMNTAPYQTVAGYKPSPAISPIFGIEPEHIAKENRLELENTANYEKLDAEIQKTNEFLAKLRDLQKKLD